MNQGMLLKTVSGLNKNALQPPRKYAHRSNSTPEEEESEEAVHLAWREQQIGTDDTPDDARCVEHLRARARKVVLLLRCAHVWDVLEHPCLDSELHETSDHGRDDLTRKHRSWPVKQR